MENQTGNFSGPRQARTEIPITVHPWINFLLIVLIGAVPSEIAPVLANMIAIIGGFVRGLCLGVNWKT